MQYFSLEVGNKFLQFMLQRIKGKQTYTTFCITIIIYSQKHIVYTHIKCITTITHFDPGASFQVMSKADFHSFWIMHGCTS